MSAALCMSALDDREDDPPHHYLRAMPDQDDRETTETLVPPTDRETNPLASPSPATMLPPASQTLKAEPE